MRSTSVLIAFVLAAATSLVAAPANAAQWGSSYGDPAAFCPAQSFLPATYATLVGNDPSVAANPEQDTFWGVHSNPGYDDWFGYWYGDFRGSPGDQSGWIKLMTVPYGSRGHWNFGSFGWSVHGHAKQYIAYYNWTFGGQCGLGRYGNLTPPPYMADVYGNPVVDIYVDTVPPWPPAPRVTALAADSVSYTWDPVADRGDGAGQDLYISGFDHYTSWWTLADGRVRDLQATPLPRTVTASGLVAGQQACVHVQASDRLANATPEQVRCGTSVAPPPLGGLRPDPGAIVARPPALGLTGLATWFALQPRPSTVHERLVQDGVIYDISAAPVGATWSFGDGSSLSLSGDDAFGRLDAEDSVTHLYEAQSRAGYGVTCQVDFAVTWTATVEGGRIGPYPDGTLSAWAQPLKYPVQQAQPELLL